MYDLVLLGADVVLEAGVARTDIGIKDGRIAAIGGNIAGASQIECSGKLILPGGVDNHCHVAQKPTSNGSNADSFETATASAALGGTTTIVCFAKQEKGETLGSTVESYIALGGTGLIDFAVHLVISDLSRPELSRELAEVVAAGIRSFKVFMTYEGLRLADAEILQVLDAARELGALVAVHAENHDAVRYGVSRLSNPEDAFAAISHARSRPPIVEAEAVRRAIMLSEIAGQPVHIFHVTCTLAADEVAVAKRRGVQVYSETCTHYLTLTEEALFAPMTEAAKFICSPPLRSEADRQALWSRISDGTIDMVSSDHSPYVMHGPHGKLKDGPDTPLYRVANGMPGLATRLPVLFHAAVAGRKFDAIRFAQLTATNPAKLYGLYPRKGVIALESDADLAVWNPSRLETVQADKLASAAGYSPFEGVSVTGWPEHVLSRGDIVVRDRALVGHNARGRYLPRAAYEFPVFSKPA